MTNATAESQAAHELHDHQSAPDRPTPGQIRRANELHDQIRDLTAGTRRLVNTFYGLDGPEARLVERLLNAAGRVMGDVDFGDVLGAVRANDTREDR